MENLATKFLVGTVGGEKTFREEDLEIKLSWY